MRNRSNTPSRSETDFVNGGSAGTTITNPTSNSIAARKSAKAQPVSISFAEENLLAIRKYIKDETLRGDERVNRSDIVRAALIGFESFSEAERSELIKKARLQ